MSQLEIYQLVAEERHRQREMWGEGELNNSPIVWTAILTEEVGEVAKEALELHFGYGDQEKLLRELVQIAAVAMAAIESLKEEQM